MWLAIGGVVLLVGIIVVVLMNRPDEPEPDTMPSDPTGMVDGTLLPITVPPSTPDMVPPVKDPGDPAADTPPVEPDSVTDQPAAPQVPVYNPWTSDINSNLKAVDVRVYPQQNGGHQVDPVFRPALIATDIVLLHKDGTLISLQRVTNSGVTSWTHEPSTFDLCADRQGWGAAALRKRGWRADLPTIQAACLQAPYNCFKDDIDVQISCD